MSVVKTFLARPYQFDVLSSVKRIIALITGVGSGKTSCASVWIINKAQTMKKGEVGLIAAETYQTLIDSTLTNFYKFLEDYEIPVRPREKPEAHRPFNIKIKVNKKWHKILCRSLTKFEALSGIELAWAYVDETFLSKQTAVSTILERLRGGEDKKGNEQLLITSTATEPGHWLHKMFIEGFNADIMDVFTATTYDNKKNLPDGYIETLKTMHSPSMFKRMVLGMFVADSTNVIYREFKRDIHISDEDIEIDPHYPLLWSHDFNCGVGKPMSSVLAQLKKLENAAGIVRWEIHIIDEFIVERSSTQEVINEFHGRYGDRYKHNMIIYGDPAGKAKDTRSKSSDFDILYANGFEDQSIDKKHPAVRDRHNIVNSVLMNAHGDSRIKISPKCKTLIAGLETTCLKEGASYTEKETYSQHVTTALGYMVCREFEIEKPEHTESAGSRYWK